jgi:hypothetical protein
MDESDTAPNESVARGDQHYSAILIRLAKMEKSHEREMRNRNIMLLLFVFFVIFNLLTAFVVMLRQHGSEIDARTVRTEELRVRKFSTNSECVIGFEPSGNSPFISLDNNGRSVLMLDVDSNTQDPRVTFFDRNEHARLELRLVAEMREDPMSTGAKLRDVSSLVRFWGPKDELRLMLGSGLSGDPAIRLNDRRERRMAALEIVGKPFLEITDASAGQAIRVGISDMGPNVTVLDGNVPTHRFPSKER